MTKWRPKANNTFNSAKLILKESNYDGNLQDLKREISRRNWNRKFN